MQTLKFTCNEQILAAECPGRLVIADTKQHVFAQFALDSEWDGLSVTAVFSNDFGPGSVSVPLMGREVAVPPEVLVEGRLRASLVGLRDGGNYRLTTAYMNKPVIVHRAGDLIGLQPEDTTPELWEQVLAIIGPMDELATIEKQTLVAAINEAYRSGGGGGGGGTYFKPGPTLTLKDGILDVNTANAAEQDNTLPITSAAVHTTVGNIELLLSRI